VHCVYFAFFDVVEYCSNYPAAAKLLGDLERNPSKKAFLTGCQYLQSQSLALSAFLLMPVQRLCKYPLLFKEWSKIRYSPRVDAAAARLENLASYVNEYTRLHEQTKAIHGLAAQIEDWPSEVSYHSQTHSMVQLIGCIGSRCCTLPPSTSPQEFFRTYS